MRKGKLIVLEGLDYSFKDTNAKKLYDYIKENITDKVELYSFPRYNSNSSFFVKEYLKGTFGDASKLKNETASIFYAMDRYYTVITEEFDRKLEEGYYIVCDRYTSSNTLFQATKLDTLFEMRVYYHDMIEEFEYKTLGIPKEDMTIFMDMPVDISFPLMQQREYKNGETKDQHESNYKFLKEVERKFKLLNSSLLHYDIVECTRDGLIKDEILIFNDILKICNKKGIF